MVPGAGVQVGKGGAGAIGLAVTVAERDGGFILQGLAAPLGLGEGDGGLVGVRLHPQGGDHLALGNGVVTGVGEDHLAVLFGVGGQGGGAFQRDHLDVLVQSDLQHTGGGVLLGPDGNGDDAVLILDRSFGGHVGGAHGDGLLSGGQDGRLGLGVQGGSGSLLGGSGVDNLIGGHVVVAIDLAQQDGRDGFGGLVQTHGIDLGAVLGVVEQDRGAGFGVVNQGVLIPFSSAVKVISRSNW